MKTDRRLISPVDRSWEDTGRLSQEIKDWEKRTGYALPDDYRRFMLKFNGGRPYPGLIRYAVPINIYPSTEPTTILSIINDWDFLIGEREGTDFGHAIPPHMLPIATDPGGLTFLLSLRSEDHGSVHCWMTSTDIWATDRNTRTWPQADSFTALLDSLFDDEDGISYDYWHRPSKERTARVLEF